MRSKIKSINSKLKKNPDLLAVLIFGSAVCGRKGKLSDLDVGILFKKPGKILENPKKSLKIYEELFDTLAPLVNNTNQLDLVFLQKAPLALQKEALSHGELIYGQEEKLADYKEKTFLKYADIKPLATQFYKEVYETRL